MSEFLDVNLKGPVARITLNRPPLNVLTTAMMREMADAVRRAGASETARLIRIDARGKVFCAGVDVGEHEGDLLRPMMDSFNSLFDAFASARIPSVCVVHGAALGGGCELALGTDLCLASERASFGQPEIRLGVFAPPASVLLPRAVGERRALGLLLTGETVPASEALAMGLVNRTFPDERFASEVDAWFERMLELSGAALRLAKRAVVTARDLPVREALERVAGLYLDELMETADASEGLRAFLEKRPPVWKHS